MILVVMKDLDSRNHISYFLQERGYDVKVPPHRQDVLAMARTLRPRLIILDLYVSDPDGLYVLEQVRAQGYTGKVIAIAGESMRSVISEAYHLGIDQIVGGPSGKIEPFNLEHLEAVMQIIFRQQIREEAYTRYEKRGQQEGLELEDWLEAEQHILKPHLQSVSSSG